MEKYYSKEKLLNSMYDMIVDDGMVVTVLDKDDLESVPTADVRPVIHAHWAVLPEGVFYHECSNCGEHDYWNTSTEFLLFDYCPDCGAIMDEEEG